MTISPDLVEELERALTNHPDVQQLSPNAAERVAADVARSFVSDATRQWWWESLTTDAVSMSYSDNECFELLARLISTNEPSILVLTDDEPPPWPAVQGTPAALFALLRDLPFVEYFLTDVNHQWVVFDTHHDELVITGDLAAKARQLGGSASRIGASGRSAHSCSARDHMPRHARAACHCIRSPGGADTRNASISSEHWMPVLTCCAGWPDVLEEGRRHSGGFDRLSIW